MAGIDRDKLRALLAQKGRTPRDLSKAVGDNLYLVRDILSGRSRNPRSDTLIKLAEELGVTLDAILSDQATDLEEDGAPYRGSASKRPKMLRLAIRYEVGAGGFHERDDLRQQPFGFEAVQAVAPYVEFPQWLERVVSDSMDRVIPVGSLLHVVDAIAIEYEPRHGDVVVVERMRQQGALVERSVKRVRLTPGGPELWPESHNPRWSGPLTLYDGTGATDDVTVQVAGLVLRSYQFFVSHAEEPDVA